MYKEDLALNNLQWFICHKTKQNQTEQLAYMGEDVVFFSLCLLSKKKTFLYTLLYMSLISCLFLE